MHLLILGKPDGEEARRIAIAAKERGHQTTIASFADVVISAGANTTINIGKIPLESFDLLLFRNFFPFISEALLVAERFHAARKRVIDTRLVTTPVIMSKMYEATILEQHGVTVPKTIQCFSADAVRTILPTMRFPLILKSVHGRGGTQVFRAQNQQAVLRLLAQAPPGTFLLQDYLPSRIDYRVLTIGYRAIGAVRRSVPENDFRTNSGLGAPAKRTPLTPLLATIAETASHALGRECAGVDIRISKGIPYVLEVNQTPGFIHFEKATKIDVAGLLIRYFESLIE
ncbi:ATP-grasp domain-containing protein [Patescibacteria group bacterium]|nr:ATP-grasp domain-containing protein [Patescibacteria group bacterium]